MRRSLRRARRSRSSRAERARGATPCVAALRSGAACSHPWGGSTRAIRHVEPRHAWLPFDQALRAATHGVALRGRVASATHGVALHVQSDHRRATPCVAAVRSGIACSHPWVALHVQSDHRRATPCVAAVRSGIACSHPWGGSTRAIRHVEPRHAWLLFDQAMRAATHGVALRVQSDHRRATPCVAAVRSGIACTHTTAATRQPKTNRPFIIAKWPGNEQKNV